MIERYEPVQLHAKKRGKCLCGKALTRAKTFEQTISPFNKMPDGSRKTREQIFQELGEERAAWMEEAPRHHHPNYWQWSDEQRKTYNDTGNVIIKMSCGFETEINKPK